MNSILQRMKAVDKFLTRITQDKFLCPIAFCYGILLCFLNIYVGILVMLLGALIGFLEIQSRGGSVKFEITQKTWRLLLVMRKWIANKAMAEAVALGQRHEKDFEAVQNGVIDALIKNTDRLILGYYINDRGGVDSNYHVFDTMDQAHYWAMKPPMRGARHALLIFDKSVTVGGIPIRTQLECLGGW